MSRVMARVLRHAVHRIRARHQTRIHRQVCTRRRRLRPHRQLSAPAPRSCAQTCRTWLAWLRPSCQQLWSNAALVVVRSSPGLRRCEWREQLSLSTPSRARHRERRGLQERAVARAVLQCAPTSLDLLPCDGAPLNATQVARGIVD
jgi:hypothetical protein